MTDKERIEHEIEVIENCAGHWFIQGGKAEFGDLEWEPQNADELIAAILRAVRNPRPDWVRPREVTK